MMPGQLFEEEWRCAKIESKMSSFIDLRGLDLVESAGFSACRD